jgi:chromosomal replication initiation ATPase DnaA
MQRSPNFSPVRTVRRRRVPRCSWRCEALAALVAERLVVTPSEILSKSRRSATAAFARQVAMYLAHVSFGANMSEIGRAFGRDRTTAAHACRLVEERRDDPHIDALLQGLERSCRGGESIAAIRVGRQ